MYHSIGIGDSVVSQRQESLRNVGDYSKYILPEEYSVNLTLGEKSMYLSNKTGAIVELNCGRLFILNYIEGHYATLTNSDGNIVQTHLSNIINENDTHIVMSNIDWMNVEYFHWGDLQLTPKVLNRTDSSSTRLISSDVDGVEYSIYLNNNFIEISNIKYKKNGQIKVQRRNSKVKGKTRSRGVAISSRAGRAKCKRCNF